VACLILAAGCQKPSTEAGPVSTTASPTTTASGQALTPTAVPVLKEKIARQEPLNVNDQMALHAMKPEERRELMKAMHKAKP
jgi:hypothetical protein